MKTLPLAGIRVLSLAEQYPGPYATMLLADLGADVILVERPGTGDPSRRFPGLFASFNRNKRSIVLDLKSEQGRTSFLELVDTADVVLEGYRPGVMARLKIGAEVLQARKPSLIYMSISSFGQSGPLAAVVGHDLSIQGAIGMINVLPGAEATATLPVLPLADISSAMFAALGVVTALFSRTRTQAGMQIDVSMLDSLLSWMTPFLVPTINNMPIRPLPPEDPGYGLFGTADGQQITLSIAGEDHMWEALCRLLALDDYATLPEVERSERRFEIVPVLRAAILTRQHDELCAELEAQGIAFGPIVKLQDVLNDPQVQAREMVVRVDGDALRAVRQPLLIDGQAGTIARPTPALGEHTDELLAELARRPAVSRAA